MKKIITISQAKKIEKPGYKLTMADVRRYNEANGYRFFSPDNMKLFSSRIESSLMHGNYFITSETKFYSKIRKYTIRRVAHDFNIETVSEYLEYSTIQDARASVKEIQRVGE